MGLFRKMTSVTTLGAVDFRSDKERIAAYTKAAKGEAKKQTKLMKQAQRREPSPSEQAVARLKAMKAAEQE